MRLVFTLLILSVVLGKFSYTDKCYRFKHQDDGRRRISYQIYVNRKGNPLSADYIVDEGSDFDYDVSYYYHSVLSNCTSNYYGITCLDTVESVWFKFIHTNGTYSFAVKMCDAIFQEKYANIKEHGCPDYPDFFYFIEQQIGTVKWTTIQIEDGKVVMGDQYQPDGKCVWEYDILGLISVVTLSIIGGIALIVLALFILMIVFVQKHRTNKRKRLDSGLLRHSIEENSV